MIKKLVALMFMAVLFSFNCENGCGNAKKGEVMEQPAETGTEPAAMETEPAGEEHK